MRATEISEHLGDELERLARSAAVAAARAYDPDRLWIREVGIVVRGAQELAASRARAATEAIAPGTLRAAPAAPAAIGTLSSGLVVERALAALSVRLRSSLNREQAGRAAIARIAHTATYDAGRAELHAQIERGPFSGWRWISRGTCAACLASDDGSERAGDRAMRVHPACRCVPSPIPELSLEALQEEFPGVELDVHENRAGILELDRIVVPEGERNAGVGSAVMRRLSEIADDRQQPIALTPATDFGGTKAGLERFYRRHGFVPNKGRAKDFGTTQAWIRKPDPRPTGAERFARMSEAEQDRAVGAAAADKIRRGELELGDLLERDTIHGERVITQAPLADA